MEAPLSGTLGLDIPSTMLAHANQSG